MKINCVDFNIENVCSQRSQAGRQVSEKYNFVISYDKLGFLFEHIQTHYLESTSDARIEGLAILLKGVAQSKGKNGDFCASVLEGKIRKLALIYPDSIKKVTQRAEYADNDNLRSIIQTVSYLTKSKFFNGYSPFGTRFSYHLANRFGLEESLRAPTILVGLALLLNGSQLVSPTQKDTDPSEAGISIGSSLIGIGAAFVFANIIAPLRKVNKEEAVNQEIILTTQDPVPDNILVVTPSSTHSPTDTRSVTSTPRLVHVASLTDVSMRSTSTDRLVANQSPWQPIEIE